MKRRDELLQLAAAGHHDRTAEMHNNAAERCDRRGDSVGARRERYLRDRAREMAQRIRERMRLARAI